MRLRVVFVCAVILAVAAPQAAAEGSVKPGKWQISMQMEMPGMPFKMPPVKMTHCVTEEDQKSAVPQNQKDKDCKVGEYKIEGKTVRWTVECEKQKISGKGEITYDDDAMSGEMVLNNNGQEMTTKYTGKRLGACEK